MVDGAVVSLQSRKPTVSHSRNRPAATQVPSLYPTASFATGQHLRLRACGHRVHVYLSCCMHVWRCLWKELMLYPEGLSRMIDTIPSPVRRHDPSFLKPSVCISCAYAYECVCVCMGPILCSQICHSFCSSPCSIILLLAANNKRLFMIGTLRKRTAVFQGANYNSHTYPTISSYPYMLLLRVGVRLSLASSRYKGARSFATEATHSQSSHE